MNRAEEYADGDLEFATWLEEVDEIVCDGLGMSVFDLRDMLFRDSYAAGETPQEFVDAVVATNVMEDFGADAADMLVGRTA
jgi:hypothetical protein